MTRQTRPRRRLTALASVGSLVVSTLVGAAAVVGVSGGSAGAAGTPSSPTDESKVPHYFGPYPNWANSPFTVSKAKVVINGPGAGAEAVAQVDPATGGIASIDVVSPGHDYDSTTTVTVSGGSPEATATASVLSSGSVVGFTVDSAGSGYQGFQVDVAGGGGVGAVASASGGVDAVTLADGGSGYTMPTVDFDLPDDPNGTEARGHVEPTDLDANGTVLKVTVDDPGSGYTTAPGVAIHNGTLYDPLGGETPAKATSTLKLIDLAVSENGSGYTSAPAVTVSDVAGGTGSGAAATATTDVGAIDKITVDTPGAGYLTPGMKKFQDELPLPCDPKADGSGCPTIDPGAAPSTGKANKFVPLAVPEEVTVNGVKADQYEIGLVQYRTKFSSDLPATLVRGYVQLSHGTVQGQQFPLTNELMDGTKAPVKGGYTGVTSPQWLGPIIAATKDKPVRIVFRNLLPNNADGDLFLPVDSTGMGSGMGPMSMPAPTDDGTVLDQVRNPACTTSDPKSSMCYKDNRATLHLHGGITPWISDGTPHQWITPAGEDTPYPEGVSVQNVPDMTDSSGAVLCQAKDDGCSTFFYTNQQSARMMFYHDHSYGITRLNVYAGEAAGYQITDPTEKKLVANGTIPGSGDTVPLIVQDRTFVPDDSALAAQDPTWDKKKWGTKGSFWYHHVYMPAQNPGDPSGMSAYGRWMYGPWFWPPATGTKYGPIDNPYYDPSCNLDKPSTWQYQTDPFCEPKQIPGTPNVSMGMEQFNDTPVVNGVAYPTTTLEPKTYRLRMLNAANDRFFNFQWYVADPTQGDGTTEVALKPAELAAAQTDPVVSPTPVDANNNAAGPDWVQIANEGGFLPAPAVIDGQQPTTWITDPTRFDVGNVDQHSLLLAPAERADVLVDFSKFAGKTLILYNDAPAAFPARVPGYDYYTGAPDLSPVGAPTPLPGYGPNTRTVMQVKIAAAPAAPALDLVKLQNAFKHHADGSGVFESGQNPTIVGQKGYNTAYGTTFAASSNCNATPTLPTCDGLVRINDGTKSPYEFGFNTLANPGVKTSLKMEPKAIHDEMNSSTFDEFGRMQANLGVEAQPATPAAQNVTLYPYVNPQTELIDGTNLPKAEVNLGGDGLPAADVKVKPMGTTKDGTQIWRFTHNGVDTHPIHFHLYDVQVLNRVTWDNIVIPNDPNELGWKDTVRMSPLEDTIVALRPVIPKTPFEVPNSVRPLNPAMPLGDQSMFNNVDPAGNPTGNIVNQLVNFGWEYVLHCHILSHEEMDMMRPVSVALPPVKADGLVSAVVGTGKSARIRLTWVDNSITETSYLVQRTTDGTTWVDAGTVSSPLDQPNTKGTPRSFTDPGSSATTPYLYRVVARNTVGYGGAFPEMTVQSVSPTLGVNLPALPAAPSNLTGTIASATRVNLSWRDNASTETTFVVERSTGGGAFSQIGTAPARAGTGGTVTFADMNATAGAAYQYRVTAVNLTGSSAQSNVLALSMTAPSAPTGVTGTAARSGSGEVVTVRWTNTSTNESGFTVQWSSTAAFTTVAGSAPAGPGATSLTTPRINRQVWYVRVIATNPLGQATSAVSPPVPAA